MVIIYKYIFVFFMFFVIFWWFWWFRDLLMIFCDFHDLFIIFGDFLGSWYCFVFFMIVDDFLWFSWFLIIFMIFDKCWWFSWFVCDCWWFSWFFVIVDDFHELEHKSCRKYWYYVEHYDLYMNKNGVAKNLDNWIDPFPTISIYYYQHVFENIIHIVCTYN